jgi:aspartyl aminopeptidase
MSSHSLLCAAATQQGMVIKHNANQRYATNAVTAFLFREVGRRAGLPTQEFAVRSDTGCGSTIGPILSTLCGVRTVDVGSPQWSMHSCREVMGTDDAEYGYQHLKAAYESLMALDAELTVDGGVSGLALSGEASSPKKVVHTD